MNKEINSFRVNAKIYESISKFEKRREFCYKQMEDGRYDTYKDEVNYLNGVLNGLRCALSILNSEN